MSITCLAPQRPNDTTRLAQITDAGLVHLKGLTNLRTLYLYGTQITDADIADLKKALPNCRVRK